MAACEKQMLQQNPFNIGMYDDYGNKSSWMIMEGNDNDDHVHDDTYNSTTSTSSIGNSTSSNRSSSSSDLVDDASSSSCSSSSAHDHNGPLFELSELMAQLPIKLVF